MTKKFYMIHALNNLPRGWYIILDHLENHLMFTGLYTSTIDKVWDKLNTLSEKIKDKNDDNKIKWKALAVQSKQ